MTHRTWKPLALFAAVVVLLSACTFPSSTATARSTVQLDEVTEIVVFYEKGAPPVTSSGRPWGSQCVSERYRDRLRLGRWIRLPMRLIRIRPPVPARVAEVIALQVSQCPYIEWAEADVVRFDVS
jgi:hypothetical protein